MEYIILDLEWDSVYYTPKKGFINQILQIGAVRLDSDFNTVGTFSATVRSEISNKVSSRFSKLTGITTEKMLSGIPLKEAIEKYNQFAGGAEVTMTWSNTDLYTIIENEDNLLGDGTRFSFKNYLDLQKLVQHHLAQKGYESKNQISLESAAELLGVNTEEYNLHTALDDCLACSALLKLSFNEKIFNSLLKDTSNPDFFARLRFKTYQISDINDSNIKSEEMQFNCPKCGKKAEKITTWKYRNRWFSANFKCNKCNFKFNGRVSFKKTYDDLRVKHKVCEYKRKGKTNKNNDMQSLPKTVQH